MSAILLKLQPNQDMTEGLEAAIAAVGMRHARVVAAVGSLVEGVIHRGAGVEIVEGPAVEIAALSGEVHVDGTSRLHGFMIRQNAEVVEGELMRGCNAVGVTFELLLEASGERC
ncbi:PCC domain-containing protein [Sphingomonas bacterium]|uniref:PCC domain-containing protein n=1 Tax=Sphingomonas bacterium TaxID=1895847 RepID=UPI0015760B9A|nr:DUF296 domain-containing protein [Sphingomonas bacterium]